LAVKYRSKKAQQKNANMLLIRLLQYRWCRLLMHKSPTELATGLG